jgi:thiol:disulfide interchange protein DsbA
MPRLLTDKKDEVIEFFSYNCPHCYYLEPELEAWLRHKSDKVIFIRIPVVFDSNWGPSARAYYVAESLGILAEIHKSLFGAIHNDKRKLNDEEDFSVFFAEHGVDNAIFHKTYKSFQTEGNLQRANVLVKRYGIRGVPAVFVNGKYEVRSQKFFEVVDFLLAK